MVALREEDCLALADRLGSGAELTWVAADLTNEDDTERAFARCAETFDRLDALLACAGGSGRPFGDGPSALDLARVVEHDGGAQPQHGVPQLA